MPVPMKRSLVKNPRVAALRMQLPLFFMVFS